jgi:hypothetical protein
VEFTVTLNNVRWTVQLYFSIKKQNCISYKKKMIKRGKGGGNVKGSGEKYGKTMAVRA